MARKIGLGDSHFEPGIEGDVDYDFFGEEKPEELPTMKETAAPKEDLLKEDNKAEVTYEDDYESDVSVSSSSDSDLSSLTDDSLDELLNPDKVMRRWCQLSQDRMCDSDSEITNVSPLSSAQMSPLPQSPRHSIDIGSPLSRSRPLTPRNDLMKRALKLGLEAGLRRCSSGTVGKEERGPSPLIDGRRKRGLRKETTSKSCDNVSDFVMSNIQNMENHIARYSSDYHGLDLTRDSDDMKLLMQAVMELEHERLSDHTIGSPARSGATTSLSSLGNGKGKTARKNMSFTNNEVRDIDRENQRLLRRIVGHHNQRPALSAPPGRVVSSAAINRLKEQKKIEVENMALLKRLQAAKPTKELSRAYLLKETLKANITLPSISLPQSACEQHSEPSRTNHTTPKPKYPSASSTSEASSAASSRGSSRVGSFSGGHITLPVVSTKKPATQRPSPKKIQNTGKPKPSHDVDSSQKTSSHKGSVSNPSSPTEPKQKLSFRRQSVSDPPKSNDVAKRSTPPGKTNEKNKTNGSKQPLTVISNVRTHTSVLKATPRLNKPVPNDKGTLPAASSFQPRTGMNCGLKGATDTLPKIGIVKTTI